MLAPTRHHTRHFGTGLPKIKKIHVFEDVDNVTILSSSMPATYRLSSNFFFHSSTPTSSLVEPGILLAASVLKFSASAAL